MSHVFSFVLVTKTRLNGTGCLFDSTGDLVGRILSESPKLKDEYDELEYTGYYHYEVESTKEIFEKLNKGEIRLTLKDYSVSSSNTYWTRGE